MARVLYGVTRNTYGHVARTQAIVGRLPEHGGHNLICEALFYPKPLLCFPIAWHFEQFLNVSHVRALGYGDYSLSHAPTLFQNFDAQLEKYRQNISRNFVDGTETVVARVRDLIG